MLRHIRSSLDGGKVSEQTAIREEMNTLVAMVKRDMAYAELQSAQAGLLTSMGIAPGEHLLANQMTIAEIKSAISEPVRFASR